MKEAFFEKKNESSAPTLHDSEVNEASYDAGRYEQHSHHLNRPNALQNVY